MLRSAQFRDNEKKSRFELLVENAVAYVEYIKEGEKIIVFRTEIPESISKIDNSASYLMKKVLQFCSENTLDIDIRCPFAKAIIGKRLSSNNHLWSLISVLYLFTVELKMLFSEYK